MVSEALPRTLQPPPELPSDPKTSDTLAQYLRTFSLWCRHGFADKLSISGATPRLIMQTADAPPQVYQMEVTSAPTITLKPVALGSGDLGPPVTMTVSTDLSAYYLASNPAGYQTAAQVTAALPVASSTMPAMDGTAAVGTGTTWARADHIHPTDTSRYAASNPSGYQTAAQVTAALPVASSTTPVMDGTAAVGAGTTWARGDHVHPTDTSRAAASALASYLPLSGGTLTGDLVVSGTGSLYLNATSVAIAFWRITGTNVAQVSFSAGNFIMQNLNAVNTPYLQLSNDGTFFYSGTSGLAYKAGGGAWAVASDARIKTVEGDYSKGLQDVLALRPIVYSYKGNDTRAVDEPSLHAGVAAAGNQFVGLIAQEVEGIFPDMVHETAGFIDGVAADIKNIDPSNLIYALVNAVKTLAAEVNALKAGAR